MSVQKGDAECTVSENMCSELRERGFSKACCVRTVCQIFTQFYNEKNIRCQNCIRREHGR